MMYKKGQGAKDRIDQKYRIGHVIFRDGQVGKKSPQHHMNWS